MNTAQRVAALEGLLERVRRNKANPRAGTFAAAASATDAGEREAPEIQVTGAIAPADSVLKASPRAASEARGDHATTPGMPAPTPSGPEIVVESAEAEIEFDDEVELSDAEAAEVAFAEEAVVAEETAVDEALGDDDEDEPITGVRTPEQMVAAAHEAISVEPPTSSEVITARTPQAPPVPEPPKLPTPSPPPLPVTPARSTPPPLPAAPTAAREVELTPTPPPLPAQAVEIAAKQGLIRLEPKTVTPQRLAVDNVADFIGEVRAMKTSNFGEIIDSALELGFE